MIIQSWRGSDWNKSDLDSTLILTFKQEGKGSILEMTHANIPDVYAKSIKKGWSDYYWKPWKAFLKE